MPGANAQGVGGGRLKLPRPNAALFWLFCWLWAIQRFESDSTLPPQAANPSHWTAEANNDSNSVKGGKYGS